MFPVPLMQTKILFSTGIVRNETANPVYAQKDVRITFIQKSLAASLPVSIILKNKLEKILSLN
jgi:hypothetical protein